MISKIAILSGFLNPIYRIFLKKSIFSKVQNGHPILYSGLKTVEPQGLIKNIYCAERTPYFVSNFVTTVFSGL